MNPPLGWAAMVKHATPRRGGHGMRALVCAWSRRIPHDSITKATFHAKLPPSLPFFVLLCPSLPFVILLCLPLQANVLDMAHLEHFLNAYNSIRSDTRPATAAVTATASRLCRYSVRRDGGGLLRPAAAPDTTRERAPVCM